MSVRSVTFSPKTLNVFNSYILCPSKEHLFVKRIAVRTVFRNTVCFYSPINLSLTVGFDHRKSSSFGNERITTQKNCNIIAKLQLVAAMEIININMYRYHSAPPLARAKPCRISPTAPICADDGTNEKR